MFEFEGTAVYVDPTSKDVSALPGVTVEFLDPATDAVITVEDALGAPVTSVTADSVGVFYARHATVYRVRPRYAGHPSSVLLTAPSAVDAAQDALTAASTALTAANSAAAAAAAAADTADDALAAALAAGGSDSAVAGYIDNSASLTTASLGAVSSAVSVKRYGAVGNGVADDTAAINAAITANAGRTIYFPPGTYMVDPVANASGWWGITVAGVLLDVPGVTLLLDRGATLEAIAGSVSGYAVVCVSAADCAIIGGHIKGERAGHIGSTGEHGMGILVVLGGDRLLVDGVEITDCWGDGIYVNGSTSAGVVTNVHDVTLRALRVHNNRRNGLSIVSANRCQVIGGSYYDTNGTAPQAGIDVEPNASSGTNVTAFTITGVSATDNDGAGILVVTPTASSVTGSITGCVCNSNGTYGIQGSTTGTGTGGVDTAGNTLLGNTLGPWYSDVALMRGQVAMSQAATLLSSFAGWCLVRDFGAYVSVILNMQSPAGVINSTNTNIATLPAGVGSLPITFGVVRNRTTATVYDLQVAASTVSVLNLTTTGANTLLCNIIVPKV